MNAHTRQELARQIELKQQEVSRAKDSNDLAAWRQQLAELDELTRRFRLRSKRIKCHL